MAGLQFGVISLFEEMFQALEYGVIGRAKQQNLIAIEHWNPRDFCEDAYRQIDDRPYGGGPGMVMMAQPLSQAIQAAKARIPAAKTVYVSPQGKTITQSLLAAHTQTPLIILAGRYEGIDQRVIDIHVDEEWSLGDYVLSGGELAAMVVIDGITRLLPGVLGHEDSAQCDSFCDGLLDHPHYTRPENLAGHHVPDVLLSGNHESIRRWRLKTALQMTLQKRPDLLCDAVLSQEQKELLNDIKNDLQGVNHE